MGIARKAAKNWSSRQHQCFSQFQDLAGIGILGGLAVCIVSSSPVLAQDPVFPHISSPAPEKEFLKAQTSSAPIAQPVPSSNPSNAIDLNPKIIEDSPVLQRWLKEVPNVLSDIENDPSFRTRFRLGYSQFPSTNQIGGLNVGVEDLFIAHTGFTFSADYQTSFTPQSVTGGNDRVNWGAGIQYYLRPLGSYINVAPVIGYRRIETSLYTSEGLNVGAKLFLVLSRGGGADLAVTQTWLAPGTSNEVGMTTLSAGYALTYHLRLSTDIQFQNSRQRQDSRVGIVLEWMP